MEIDIISFTDSQYAALTQEQLLEVRAAQQKKNRLEAKRDEELAKGRARLIKNGIFNSDLASWLEAKLWDDCEREVSLVREGLLFYLKYVMKPLEGVVDAPYNVDYALSYDERLAIVREYYESTYTDWKELYQAFLADMVVQHYLGEAYAPLHDFYMIKAK